MSAAGRGRKVIVSCAVTGGVHTPSMSPALPLTPDEIAREALAAAEAGAAIVHLHARGEEGRPSADPDIFMRFLPRIRAGSDVVVNITTGGALGMSLDDRLAAARRARPELASLNMGSMNFGLFPAADQARSWKYAWEQPYLRATDDLIFRNTFRDMAYILSELGGEGTKFEHECYDTGHLYALAHVLDRGLVRPPLFVQSVFGILGGCGVHPEDVAHMRRTADRLFGDAYVWSVLAAGRHQFPVATQAALMGGSVRVGLEDNLYIAPGRLAAGNAEQVSKMTALLRELALEPATPAEARAMLDLKGGGHVGF